MPSSIAGASSAFAVTARSPDISRLAGTLQQIQTPSTRPPFVTDENLTSRIETVVDAIGALERRIGGAQTRLDGLTQLQDALTQAAADLARIRDEQLSPVLAARRTNPSAADFDTQRNSIDGLLDAVTPVASELLSDPDGVQAALEQARGIINGSGGGSGGTPTGVIGDAEFYGFFTAAGGGADIANGQAVLSDTIAVLTAEATAVGEAADATRSDIAALQTAALETITTGTAATVREPLLALGLQLGNPQAFGLFRPGTVNDRSA